jgi:hypothetical protein
MSPHGPDRCREAAIRLDYLSPIGARRIRTTAAPALPAHEIVEAV